jgi:hypothetical protein
VANLAGLYPKTTFNDWEPELVLAPVSFVNTSGKAGAQIPHLPLGDDSSSSGR